MLMFIFPLGAHMGWLMAMLLSLRIMVT